MFPVQWHHYAWYHFTVKRGTCQPFITPQVFATPSEAVLTSQKWISTIRVYASPPVKIWPNAREVRRSNRKATTRYMLESCTWLQSRRLRFSLVHPAVVIDLSHIKMVVLPSNGTVCLLQTAQFFFNNDPQTLLESVSEPVLSADSIPHDVLGWIIP